MLPNTSIHANYAIQQNISTPQTCCKGRLPIHEPLTKRVWAVSLRIDNVRTQNRQFSKCKCTVLHDLALPYWHESSSHRGVLRLVGLKCDQELEY